MCTTTRLRSLLAALAASALVVSACGSDEDTDDAAGATAAETTEAAAETTEPTPETTEAAPETTEPTPETTEAAPETTEAAPETTEAAPEQTGPVPPEPPADFTGDRLTIFTTFTDPGMISQGVVMEGECLSAWVRSIPDGDLPLWTDPSTEDSDFSPESLELANELFDCLDVVYLAEEYAKEFGRDSSCVIEEFVKLDLSAFVAEEGRDIDLVFGYLADTAYECG